MGKEAWIIAIIISIALISIFYGVNFSKSPESHDRSLYDRSSIAKKQKRYFNSFHDLNNIASTETYIHITNDSNFDAQIYSTITGNLIESVSGVIKDSLLQNNSGHILGSYGGDSISINMGNAIITVSNREE